jgi:hypothetical protein
VLVRLSSHFRLEKRAEYAVRPFNRRGAEDAELRGVLPEFFFVILRVSAVKFFLPIPCFTAVSMRFSSHFWLKKLMDSAVRQSVA